MKGKLFIVEGASASGKSTLLGRISGEGFRVMRGLASQNPAENSSLTQISQEVIGDAVFNLREALRMQPAERDNLIKRFIEVARIQQEEALRLKSQGESVVLNRSAFSLISILQIPLVISDPSMRDYLSKWTDAMLDEPIKLRAELLAETDGIVFMKNASVGGKEREGMVGVQEIESSKIAEQIGEVTVPVLQLDANIMSVNEELVRVKSFLRA